MAERYGIIVTLKVKEGKMEELLELSKGHFLRQHDGREPNATLASIVMPLPDDPNTIRYFEQWVSKEDYELHSNHENLQFFFGKAGPLLDGAPVIVEAPMIHYAK
uniref:ABM domain-containing protein n=1 Tax=Ditylum brightwellii TaxID=49249 RepID=A0A7S4V5A3_9STRA|mmetsp:Transcript_23916/g.35716  ORF Transcript_23916/g.35716 Transcript_23916/m.35716 type:complete len:105 (-) Transcript_23916:344-658(-)